jgi:hypothetical protein
VCVCVPRVQCVLLLLCLGVCVTALSPSTVTHPVGRWSLWPCASRVTSYAVVYSVGGIAVVMVRECDE